MRVRGVLHGIPSLYEVNYNWAKISRIRINPGLNRTELQKRNKRESIVIRNIRAKACVHGTSVDIHRRYMILSEG